MHPKGASDRSRTKRHAKSPTSRCKPVENVPTTQLSNFLANFERHEFMSFFAGKRAGLYSLIILITSCAHALTVSYLRPPAGWRFAPPGLRQYCAHGVGRNDALRASAARFARRSTHLARQTVSVRPKNGLGTYNTQKYLKSMPFETSQCRSRLTRKWFCTGFGLDCKDQCAFSGAVNFQTNAVALGASKKSSGSPNRPTKSAVRSLFRP